MSEQPVYEARNIYKSYGNVRALSGVGLRVHAGEVVGLVGDNGAGKSTLVSVLSGAQKPDAGTLVFEGEERKWDSPRDALNSGIETLYQDSGLCPDLSVAANIFLGRETLMPGLLGKLGFLDNRSMERSAAVNLAEAGIAFEGTNRPVDQFSGGQRQAVAIGRSVTWARKVILLDEPTNHLGARQSREVLEVIKRARARGLAIVLISHTLAHILEITDRIVVLRLGEVAADAPTRDFTPDSLLKIITGLERSSDGGTEGAIKP